MRKIVYVVLPRRSIGLSGRLARSCASTITYLLSHKSDSSLIIIILPQQTQRNVLMLEHISYKKRHIFESVARATNTFNDGCHFLGKQLDLLSPIRTFTLAVLNIVVEL